MTGSNRVRGGLALITGVLILPSLVACAPTQQIQSPRSYRVHNQNIALAGAVLTKVGKRAADSFYACMADGYWQGLSLDQVSDMCASKLVEDDKKGFGGPFGDIGHHEMFDPSNISVVCSTGDSAVSHADWDFAEARVESENGRSSYGTYSWGGFGSTEYIGLTQEESERRKYAAIEAFQHAMEEKETVGQQYMKVEGEFKKAKESGNKQEIKRLSDELDELNDKMSEASAAATAAMDKADADPNKRPVTTTIEARTVDESPCQQALDQARELLRECNRTAWKDFRCQNLQSKLQRCPDPALILVDPSLGYTCGSTPDAEALRIAWVARCLERKKPGPDGSDPCEPPLLEESGRSGTGRIGDICSDPRAFLNPDKNDCNAVLKITRFGQRNVQEILVWGMNKLGGPIIVLPPHHPKSPRPGPEPRPGPTP